MNAAQANAAVDLLRQPLPDREREIYTDLSGIMLLDDSGGQPIEAYDDVTACHFFLKWLHQQRQQSAKRLEVQTRRNAFTVIDGGHTC